MVRRPVSKWNSLILTGGLRTSIYPGPAKVEAMADNTPVRVAVVQAAPGLFDTGRSLQKVADLAADAASRSCP